jgi:hypothetical protein
MTKRLSDEEREARRKEREKLRKERQDALNGIGGLTAPWAEVMEWVKTWREDDKKE